MAQLVQDPTLRDKIEFALDYLLREWSGVQELAGEWNNWDEDSRLVFELNWAVPEDWLHQLQQWAEQGVLTPEQRCRYADLLKLVAQQRPTLERLLAD